MNDNSKLAELGETCQLMAIVLEFQQQTMSILTSGTLEDLILENMKVWGVGAVCIVGVNMGLLVKVFHRDSVAQR